MFDPSKPAVTLAAMLQRSFNSYAERPCLGTKIKQQKQNVGAIHSAAGESDKTANAYSYATYREVAARVKDVAGGLLSLGLERGDRAAILAESRPEWAMGDLACQMMGIISVPLFSTLPSGQVQYILKDSGAALVLVSTKSQLQKISAIQDNLPDLRYIVMMDEIPAEEATDDEANQTPPRICLLSFADLERRGVEWNEQNPTEYETTWPAAAADDVATIIYTSGTTGEPKGVMLTHRNLTFNIEAISEALIEAFGTANDELFLSFLPLAHVYERVAGYYVPLRLGAGIAYCESLFTIDKNMREARPTVMFCVPRLYESMREKLLSAADALPPDQQTKYLDALELAKKAGAAKGHLEGAPALSMMEQIKYRVYDAKVYSKIRERFGGRLRAFVSGGAPMSPELGALFLGLGINILEGYGLTETSPVIVVNRPGRVRLATVGEPLKAVEVKIAEDGEILTRSDSVMKGYWNKPEATAEAIDSEGWFHTGDIGEFKDGYLKITDRKKDLLVLANGKKVAPAPIEMKLALSPYIAQVVLLGDKQKAVSALIVPKMEAVRSYAKQENIEAGDDAELLKTPQITKLLRKEVDSLTDDLADFERIRKINLIPDAFTVENGELTPTLKVKRRVVAEKYGHLIAGE
ncbi:MAG: long-chain fatty acid--CoA ligase [Abitibacteriaceae bacterium]|nr:long-chain fatty acid--CoA ligase [Abditibacteriaceae bacterium]